MFIERNYLAYIYNMHLLILYC